MCASRPTAPQAPCSSWDTKRVHVCSLALLCWLEVDEYSAGGQRSEVMEPGPSLSTQAEALEEGPRARRCPSAGAGCPRRLGHHDPEDPAAQRPRVRGVDGCHMAVSDLPWRLPSAPKPAFLPCPWHSCCTPPPPPPLPFSPPVSEPPPCPCTQVALGAQEPVIVDLPLACMSCEALATVQALQVWASC